ncbi:tripartite tricarboxylate transporter TctB family protein [Bosea sp. RAF48]|uniref:tripartite tricarboxylate transporter TctB family protein n=1 Tax=Bosea sp. RAF48 TaxID=3237480 RepID=UPI003F937AB8
MTTRSADLWSGLLLMAIGLFGSIWAYAYYPIGSAVRMGPAYFPIILGALLASLGLIITLNALAAGGPQVGRFHWRPLALILAAIAGFGYLIGPSGLLVAIVVLVVIGAAAGHEFRWKEVASLAAGMAIFSALIFVKVLSLPFPLWPSF